MKFEQMNIRLTSEHKEALKKIANLEKLRTGYNVTPSGIVTKAIMDIIKSYSVDGKL